MQNEYSAARRVTVIGGVGGAHMLLPLLPTTDLYINTYCFLLLLKPHLFRVLNRTRYTSQYRTHLRCETVSSKWWGKWHLMCWNPTIWNSVDLLLRHYILFSV